MYAIDVHAQSYGMNVMNFIPLLCPYSVTLFLRPLFGHKYEVTLQKKEEKWPHFRNNNYLILTELA